MVETRKLKRLGISSSAKKQLKNNDNDIAPIHKLPKEMMICEILARLAASSRIDLFNAKLSCSLFNGMANEDYIYRHMSLDRIPPPEWMKSEVHSFFRRCKQSGNPEAFYIEGVISFLRDPEGEDGLALLSKAASSGHSGASYVLGIDRICNGTESDRQHGIKLLGSIGTSSALRDCRNNLKIQLRCVFWIYNVNWSIEAKFLDCPMIKKKNTPAWPLLHHEEDRMRCRICRWNLEIHHVDCILREDCSTDGPERCERIID